MAGAFGSRYEELKGSSGGRRAYTATRRAGAPRAGTTWFWAFLGKWSVDYEEDKSRGKGVPRGILGDYPGIVISDSWVHGSTSARGGSTASSTT